MDCIFCKIASGKIPARVVYQDDQVLAFEDLAPQAPTHVLIIPKRHISTVLEVQESDRELIGHMLMTAAKVARDRGFAANGFRTVLNCNADGGQTVFHLHMHVLGGRAMNWPPG